MCSFVILPATSTPTSDIKEPDTEEYSYENGGEHFIVVPHALTYEVIEAPKTSALQTLYLNFVQSLPDATQFEQRDSLWKKHQLQRNYPLS